MNDDSSSQIVAALRRWLTTAPPGARLPSTRDLVAEHQASPVTVQKALRELARLGLVETRPGVGTFARSVRPPRPTDFGWQTAALRSPQDRIPTVSTALRSAPNDVLALHSGYPDRELLPERLVRAALTRAARGDAALARPPAAGLPDLQGWFASELRNVCPPDVSPPTASDVIVLPGSQSGLSSLFRSLVTRGQPILLESPTYWGAITAAAQAGVRVVPVPSDTGGPDPVELDRAFAETGARVFYAQPTWANPTGAQWTTDRADEILEVVRAHNAFLIEDDWAHDFGITSEPHPLAARDEDGHVIYIRSLTKSVSPALRIAAVIARGPARDRILADRGAESMYVTGVLQAAALDVVTAPGWRTHQRSLRQQLRSRRDLLAESLARHAPLAHLHALPTGGLNLWVRLPDGIDAAALAQACERTGLLIAAGNEWFPAEPTGPYVRLNFSGPNPACFADAARILGRAIDETVAGTC
jgi:DNA-binding transcriptional MocR family regulator